MASSPRKGPQQSIAAVAAALTASDDAEERFLSAAAAVAAAADACRIEIWGGTRPEALVCRAVWSGAGDAPAEGPGADERPDLHAVFAGDSWVEWRVGDGIGKAAGAVLERHGATRTLTFPLSVGTRTVGAVTIMQAGPTAKVAAAERRRLQLLGPLLAGAVDAAAAASTSGPALRRAAALRSASQAVAMLVECDQAVEAVTSEVAGMIGGAECRARVFLRNDAGAYVAFPPRQGDEVEGTAKERPSDLEQQAIDERRTVTAATSRAVRLATPLLLRGAPLGFISVIAARSRPLDADEVGDIEALAQQISLSLDIARLRRSVQRLTTIDTLTGLKNREFLFERLAAEIVRARRYSEPLSMVLADLDDFRHFNARHGNHEGNRLLRQAANLMKMSVREQVDVVCRYGGEEFALLLPNTPATAGGAGVVAERVRTTIEKTRFHDEEDNPLGRMTMSLGVAGFPVHAEDTEDLVSLAGEALRAAKAAGKNRVGLYKLRR